MAGNFKAVNGFGLDKEIADRMNAKYDKNLEADIQAWIERTTGASFSAGFGESLKNGVILCELVNTLMPGKIKKINKSGGLFRFQENITNFLRVCRQVGVNEASLFPTESLAQLKDLNQVLTCVNAFKKVIEGKGKGGGAKWSKPVADKQGGPIKKKKSKWVVKPGGSAGVSLLNQGSAGIMEPTRHRDAREQIKRNQLAGAGAANGEVSGWNKGASKTEKMDHMPAREKILRQQLDGAGAEGEVSALNQGSHGMDTPDHIPAREKIMRGDL